jgi:hypothetical protein
MEQSGSYRGRATILALLLTVLLGAVPLSVNAAQLDGVYLSDVRKVAGANLVLNGIALRTYSLLRIHLYVAGLYLERRNNSAEAVLRSPEVKLLEVHFLHNVSQEDVRNEWRRGFAANCQNPCRLNPRDIERFIARVPGVRDGDVGMFLFTRNGLSATFNGRLLGTTSNPYFAQQVLGTFLGPAPAAPEVKQGLMGGG